MRNFIAHNSKDLAANQDKILKFLATHGQATESELVKALGYQTDRPNHNTIVSYAVQTLEKQRKIRVARRCGVSILELTEDVA